MHRGTSVLAVAALAACTSEPSIGPVGASGPSAYGPDNTWFHAHVDDVDESVASTKFAKGQPAPNFVLEDQFNDEVALYQFTGKLVLIDVYEDPGELVETEIEGACPT